MIMKPNLNDPNAEGGVEAAARLLDQHPDFRTLRRLGDPAKLAEHAIDSAGVLRIGVSIDVETAGLNPLTDPIIEIALQRFRFNSSGRIVEVGAVRSWREDPGFPLPLEIVKLTGLVDADLQGQSIDTTAATDLLRSADLVIAHNAAFDRKFVEARLPDAAGLPWACSLVGVDWKSLGFEGRSLAVLVMQCGWFYPPHRASVDVAALLHLLAYECNDGDRLLAKIIADSERKIVRIEAQGAPFEIKDALKICGYRWDATEKTWWVEVDQTNLETELLGLQRAGYLRTAKLTTITARDRFH